VRDNPAAVVNPTEGERAKLPVQLDPRWRVVTSVLFGAYVAIHARFDQTGCDHFAEKEVVEPETLRSRLRVSIG
jgi:hypothetical protein